MTRPSHGDEFARHGRFSYAAVLTLTHWPAFFVTTVAAAVVAANWLEMVDSFDGNLFALCFQARF